MPTSDDIGNRGQAICFELLTRLCGPRNQPLFRPWFLGDKFPTFDDLVELVGLSDRAAYFFVQVKTTTRGYTRHKAPRLKVRVSEEDVRRMRIYPAPTYVIGVEERGKKAFLVSVTDATTGGMTSLPTRHPLNARNLYTLWREVDRFWASKDTVHQDTGFSA